MRIGRQIALEPHGALEVEIIRRFVEQQEIGLGKQRSGERDTHAPAAREGVERAALGIGIEAEAGQDGAGARLGRMGVDVDQPGVQLGDAMRIGRGVGLGEQVGALAVGRDDGLQQVHRAARRLLRDGRDARPAAQLDVSVVRLDPAGDQAQERRFARAVGADEADPVADRHDGAGALQEDASGDAACYVVNSKHGAGVIARGRQCEKPDTHGRRTGVLPGRN